MICFAFLIASLCSFAISVNLLNALCILIMCTRPITILNPKISAQTDFNPRYDKEYITIPCNDCPDCIGQRHNEWLSRAWYEYKNCKAQGGKVCFLTFTYNDYFLPKYNGVPCFDKTDITKFFKNYRKQLKVLYGRNVEFRYLVTSEYGKKECRPHYHMLLYFYDVIDDYDIFKFAWCCWSPIPSVCLEIFPEHGTDIDAYLVKDDESGEYIPLNRGMVQIGKNRDGVLSLQVNDILGIYYCTKYLLKDSEWFKVRNRLFCSYVKYRLPHFQDEKLVLSSDFVKDNPCLVVLQKEFLNEIKNYDLFHRQSLGFGSCIVSLCNDCFNTEKIPVPDPHDLSKNNDMPLPLYIQRKLFYDTKKHIKGLTLKLCHRGSKYQLKVALDYSLSYVLSEKGARHRVDVFDDMIERKCVQLQKLRSLVPTDEFMRIYFPSYNSAIDVWKEFDYLLNGRPLRYLFEYQTIFKDRNMIDSFCFNVPLRFKKSFYLFFNSPLGKEINFHVSQNKYNSHILFIHFDYLLDIISKFKKLESFMFHSKCIDVYNKRQKVDSELGKYRNPRLKNIPKLSNF